MRRMLVLVLLLVGGWLAQAQAAGLPQDGSVKVFGDLGERLGSGSLHDGLLQITMTDATDGFVTLQIVGSDLSVRQIQGLIVNGVLYVVLQEGVVPARAYAERYATQLVVNGSDTVGADAVPDPN